MAPIVESQSWNMDSGKHPDLRRARAVIAMMGSRQHYQPMKSAYENGNLVRFITDFWFAPDSSALMCARALPVQTRDLCRSRFAGDLRHADVVALAGVGIMQYFGVCLKLGRRWPYRVYCLAGRRFAQRCIRYLDVPHTAFMGYTSTALEALEHENRSGVMTVVNQIDAAKVGEEIMLSEMARHKEWVLEGHDPIPDEYFERVSAEWSAARRVIVNSAWTRSALAQQGVPAAKIRVCPLSYAPRGGTARARHRAPDSTLKVLWLGRLCIGKGIVYAIEAARRLGRSNVHFTFAGANECRLPALPANCTHIGKIPRQETGSVYSSHDIFIFPTLSDGFGLTQVEAMAHGLPVISTPQCGEVVEHGVSGLIVPPRDARALTEAILEIGRDSGKLEAMSVAALRRAGDFAPDRVWPAVQSCLV